MDIYLVFNYILRILNCEGVLPEICIYIILMWTFYFYEYFAEVLCVVFFIRFLYDFISSIYFMKKKCKIIISIHRKNSTKYTYFIPECFSCR